LKPGPADKSYGIAVARLAGLPHSVIERAREVLADFEKGEALSIGQLAPERGLLAADRPPDNPIIEQLKATDIERLSPLDAFHLLVELKRRATE
jgi:DNA mismatch repair protein MutS